METASTSGLIAEYCPVGEEGPHWCLPARFYSSTSISSWASHLPLLFLLAFHHSSLPPSVLASCTSPTCVCTACVCLDVSGAQLVVSAVGGEGVGKRGKCLWEMEPRLQSGMTQSGCISAPGENAQNMYQKHTALVSPVISVFRWTLSPV